VATDQVVGKLRILLITPPMIQLNTPYPATAYLKGFLALHQERLSLVVTQADPALELFLRLFSKQGLTQVRHRLNLKPDKLHASVQHFREHGDSYINTIDSVIRFLQGRDPSLALRIVARNFIPEGPRFAALGDADAVEATFSWAFGNLGLADAAKHLASLYIDDLADVIQQGIDAKFELSRYGEKLAASSPSFDPLERALQGAGSLIDEMLDSITAELFDNHRPDLVAISVPFPGNVYGGLRMARQFKKLSPAIKVALGGGYVNTELRTLQEPRLFDYVDYVTLDDGEAPLLALIDHLRDRNAPLKRTFVRIADNVRYLDQSPLHDVPMRDVGTPTYVGLPLDSYVSMLEMLNPVHRLWSDGRWNKLTVAHGCYWKKCTFCDVTLDYISRYDPASADALVDRIEALIAETGQTGFHFVDEAAPPAGLKALAEKLLERKVAITWWGNVRFEKTFTPELCELLATSGCVAISGGLEAASDRLLQLMKKGVTVAQVAQVTRAFSDAGIMVHAYLMYGFPTETTQETIDSLERVRQLFEAGCVQSAFWHRFAATAHSPIGKQPELYGIRLHRAPNAPFAHNDVEFTDPTGTDHDSLGKGLRRALYNYMQGVGFDQDIRSWFDKASKVPKATVDPRLIELALR
jgi:radical SAM superfamily enzyme YgiQ (UPF0313 family)